MTSFTDPVRQEIWATVRAMNDAWTKGDPDDLTRWFHRDMVAIAPTQRHRIEGGPACVAAWKAFCGSARIHRWEERDPVIHVHGDAAVVAYDFDMSFDRDGRSVRTGGRDLFFLVKEEGRWWAVADQFSPYPG
jgi:ketosteroid isomerase-like protein